MDQLPIAIVTYDSLLQYMFAVLATQLMSTLVLTGFAFQGAFDVCFYKILVINWCYNHMHMCYIWMYCMYSIFSLDTACTQYEDSRPWTQCL
jgi:hypothetical protein